MEKISKDLLINFLYTMMKVRMFEEKVIYLFQNGELPGWIHTYIGEEAVAVGVCSNLEKTDCITSHHRGHGHCIAKGLDIKKMMAELYAKKDGVCKARGGSMHMADANTGVLGANGIVGGGIPIATGAGLGFKYLNKKSIAVSFFGDGASEQGCFHESLNLASVWKLPVIYVCENNLYAETNPISKHMNIENIADRAKSYGIPGVIVDGMDVLDVFKKIKKIVADVREGGGPVLVEAKTYRFRGHYEGDPQVYRSKKEVKKWQQRDPIKLLESELLKEKILDELGINKMKNQIENEIKDSIIFAKNSPEPLKTEVMDFVY